MGYNRPWTVRAGPLRCSAWNCSPSPIAWPAAPRTCSTEDLPPDSAPGSSLGALPQLPTPRLPAGTQNSPAWPSKTLFAQGNFLSLISTPPGKTPSYTFTPTFPVLGNIVPRPQMPHTWPSTQDPNAASALPEPPLLSCEPQPLLRRCRTRCFTVRVVSHRVAASSPPAPSLALLGAHRRGVGGSQGRLLSGSLRR